MRAPARHHRSTHPTPVRTEVLALVDRGLNDCEIARRTGIPRSTVRHWRRPKYRRKTTRAVCPRCWRASKPIRFTPQDYAELLGLYLGDGSISTHARTARLRIFLDAKYPRIVRDTKALLERSLPANSVCTFETHEGAMSVVSVYSSHLACLFPNASEGKKHECRISLEDWQQRLIAEAPWEFLRGCIRSDGCVFENKTGPYRYLSYDFSNRSEDIVALFTGACDVVGVVYRVTCWRGLWRVRINRRSSVDLMLAEVGVKC